MAYWANGSARLASLRSRYTSGSKPFTSQAKCTGKVDESNFVIGAPPDTPAVIARQVAATSLPTGVIAPMPVTTTRRFTREFSLRRFGILQSGSRFARHLRVQVPDGVTDRSELLRVLVGDVDIELLLEL